MSETPVALRVLLFAALGAVAWLVSPFVDALLVAAVAAVVAWPLHEWLARIPRMPRLAATGLSVLLFTLGVVVPVAPIFWLVSRELVAMVNALALAVNRDVVDSWITTLGSAPGFAWLVEQAGGGAALGATIRGAISGALLGLGTDLGQYIPSLLGVTARAVLKVALFFVTLATLFHRGDEFAAWAKRMSPLALPETARLFLVFTQFARNVVLAGVTTAMVQATVAAIGYGLARVDQPLLLGVLTGVLAFVPLVGTAAAWVPITLLLVLEQRSGAAIFVTVWSLALTGTVDNLLKPLIVRGRSDMPALLVFLGVFGGLVAFGFIGLLVGPVLMALLLALLRIYDESRGTPAAGTVRAL